ncbi:MAG TPA: hypothetical protein VLF66_02875 [Thermoanaerobaculia bacterium]|nr:hypothetical protein [Thermoanaerobaculia bacterium]
MSFVVSFTTVRMISNVAAAASERKLSRREPCVECHDAEGVPDRVVQFTSYVRSLLRNCPERCLLGDARAQFLLRTLALGDIEQQAVEQRRRSVGRPDAPPPFEDPDDGPLGAYHSVLTGEVVLVDELRLDLGGYPVAILRMDNACERTLTVPDKALCREAGDHPDLVADELHRPIGVLDTPVDHPRQGTKQFTNRVPIAPSGSRP